MASSDDEGETFSQSVTNYHFVNDKNEPVTFSNLPVQWKESDDPDSAKNLVFLYGTGDDGIQKIYKQVTSWKIELLNEEPEISVFSKDKNWIKLVKPRKSYEDMIRTILITVRCLHIVKKNPETLGKPLWDQMRKMFSAYEVKPSENDLLDHIPLMRAAIKNDGTLTKSKYLATFLENPVKRKDVDEDDHSGPDAKKSKFIVEDDDDELDEDIGAADEDKSESDEEPDLFDSVCCICDNGGELLGCEGRCMRSFHATVDAGEESACKSLGFSRAEVEAIQNFLCLNCQYQRHQCYACGKLGSSDKTSGAEVFSCVSATCGFFYHPQCVARLLHPKDDVEAEELQKKIAGGESFTCPAHKCHICKERENKDVEDLQFAVCRRCPRAYHRKCLPSKINFEDSDDEEDVIARAWDGLLTNNRVLIYCLKHEIDDDLRTPIRNHIVFPRDEKKHKRLMDLKSSKEKVVKRRSFFNEDSPSERTVVKKPKYSEKISSDVRDTSSIQKREKPSSGKELDSPEKSKISDSSKKLLKDGSKSAAVKAEMYTSINETWLTAAEGKLNSLLTKGSVPVKSNKQETSVKSERPPVSASQMKRQSTLLLQVDAEAKQRISALMEKAKSSITLEEVIKEHKVPSTHAYSSRHVVDKTITHGKVEGFVEAVRTALQRLEEGGSVDDARAVCGPEVVNQIVKWKNKLKVYLAPFLHGMRYTSFGRHFTKVDKLKEIVDKLHWYVNDGDMVVDFCCGSNDFCWLMKEKLEQTGKKCSFKNYDIIQPKNDFCFEKRDWMTVQPKELPSGSKLIMGLNPPFGVKASLANQFVNKALQFKPKLVILIVPPETERLDRKRLPYDLVWEDEEKVSGKSFYLPGSVDVNENPMEQWNNVAPLLYLWSHRNWTAKHEAIAKKQGHTSSYQKERHSEENEMPRFTKEPRSEDNNMSKYQVTLCSEENQAEAEVSDHPMDISPIHDYPGDISMYSNGSNQTKDLPGRNNKSVSEGAMAMTPGKQNGNSSGRKKKHRKNKKGRQDKVEFPRNNMAETSPSNWTGHKNTVEGLELSEKAGTGEGIRTLQPSFHGPGLDYRAGYGGAGTSIPGVDVDEIAKRYTSSGAGSFLRGMDSYGRNPYRNDLGEYRGEPDVRQILQTYGGQGPDSPLQRGHLLGQDTGIGRAASLSTYGIPGAGAESSYRNGTGSAMSRYAPRLDELNHGRVGGFGFETSQASRSGMLDGLGSQYPPGGRPGFAPGPQHPFPPHNSSGWLNE